MSNFLTELIDGLNLKTNIWKVLTKWIVGVMITLMSAAFIFGQIKMARLNRLDDFEKTQKQQIEMIKNLEINTIAGFQEINNRIDRKGHGKIRLLDISIVDEKNENTSVLTTGQKVSFLFKLIKITNDIEFTF